MRNVKNNFKLIDKTLLFLVIILCVIGLMMVFSSSTISTILRYDVPTYYFFIRQSIYFLAAFFIGVVFIINFPLKKYNSWSYIFMFGFLVTLVLLLIYGKTLHEVRRTINLRFFNFQPADFFKLILVLFSAQYYNALYKSKNNNFLYYLVPLGVSMTGAGLVFLQPDFGSALIIFLIGVLMFISVPNKTKNIKIKKTYTVFAIFILMVIGYLVAPKILSERQLNRFTFKEPCNRYEEETGYQVCNGFIAIKNGGIKGQGLGNSTQKYLYLPESHTDFIFPIIVEETGLIGGALVLIIYLFLLFRIYYLATISQNLKNSFIIYGVFLILLSHILINLLGILAIIPLTGVPLPFLSYGGTSSLMFITSIFLVERAVIENKQTSLKKELRMLS